jgi:hypothetical protein
MIDHSQFLMQVGDFSAQDRSGLSASQLPRAGTHFVFKRDAAGN